MEISQAAQLSRVYTNHWVMPQQSPSGVPNCHIMAISGYRNEQSLAHYNTHPSTRSASALQQSPFQASSRVHSISLGEHLGS